MIRCAILFAALSALGLGACNRNSATGNDREAQMDPAPAPAPRMPAAQALSGIATEAVQAETMSEADTASLGGLQGKSVIRLTAVGFPSFMLDGRSGVIKLNGKLIPLRADRDGMFADGQLRVVVRPVDDKFNADGVREADMIVMLPGAKDEIGYRGYEDCSRRIG
ncbi:MAG: DUF6692 family protein [Sphingomonadaceae bacterium]